jgi:hypothetical protein
MKMSTDQYIFVQGLRPNYRTILEISYTCAGILKSDLLGEGLLSEPICIFEKFRLGEGVLGSLNLEPVQKNGTD